MSDQKLDQTGQLWSLFLQSYAELSIARSSRTTIPKQNKEHWVIPEMQKRTQTAQKCNQTGHFFSQFNQAKIDLISLCTFAQILHGISHERNFTICFRA